MSISASVNPSVRRALISASPAFDLRQRRAAGRRQPKPPRAAVIRIGAPLDQARRGHPIHQPADAGRTEVERRARLAHQHPVPLTENKEQAGLRGRYPVLLRPCRDPALQPALRDVEQEDEAAILARLMRRGGFEKFSSHAKYIGQPKRVVTTNAHALLIIFEAMLPSLHIDQRIRCAGIREIP